MALSNQEVLDAIAAKSVLEISELIKMMEEKFGVSAAAAAVAGAAPSAARTCATPWIFLWKMRSRAPRLKFVSPA